MKTFNAKKGPQGPGLFLLLLYVPIFIAICFVVFVLSIKYLVFLNICDVITGCFFQNNFSQNFL